MNILLDLLFIQICVVIVVDETDLVDTIKRFISRLILKQEFTNWRMKPLDCSLCLNTWISIIYTIVIGNFTIVNLTFILLLSFLTPVTYELLNLTKNTIIKICSKLN